MKSEKNAPSNSNSTDDDNDDDGRGVVFLSGGISIVSILINLGHRFHFSFLFSYIITTLRNQSILPQLINSPLFDSIDAVWNEDDLDLMMPPYKQNSRQSQTTDVRVNCCMF